jgi:hypothetical protein
MKISNIIQILIVGVVGVISLTVIRGITESVPTDNMTTTEAALITQVIPTMMPIAIILGMFAVIGGGIAVVHYLKWNSFGERMKAAYAAKFGGENKEFNSEVDMHINAMKALGSGQTKSVNMDWLKRMAKFVEIPFVIPEEEYMSEEDKTREFDNKN